jgi:multimeric flavodoxin WrbA
MSGTKIVVLLGSPRKKGNSAALAEQLISGALAKGAEVETFYLQGMDINPCTGCDACQKKTADDCKFYKDDMQVLYPKLREADVIVYVSPVYWFSVSAQIKAVIDRGYAFLGPGGEKALAGKRMAVLLTYEASDPFSSGAVNAIRMFQDMFAYIGAENAGMLYGSAHKAGEIKSNGELMAKAVRLGEKLAVLK